MFLRRYPDPSSRRVGAQSRRFEPWNESSLWCITQMCLMFAPTLPHETLSLLLLFSQVQNHAPACTDRRYTSRRTAGGRINRCLPALDRELRSLGNPLYPLPAELDVIRQSFSKSSHLSCSNGSSWCRVSIGGVIGESGGVSSHEGIAAPEEDVRIGGEWVSMQQVHF
jgi:hypothetical protein